jgi:hypothetical protein
MSTCLAMIPASPATSRQASLLSLSLQQIGAVASKSSSRHCNRCAMEKFSHCGLIDEVAQILSFEI